MENPKHRKFIQIFVSFLLAIIYMVFVISIIDSYVSLLAIIGTLFLLNCILRQINVRYSRFEVTDKVKIRIIGLTVFCFLLAQLVNAYGTHCLRKVFEEARQENFPLTVEEYAVLKKQGNIQKYVNLKKSLRPVEKDDIDNLKNLAKFLQQQSKTSTSDSHLASGAHLILESVSIVNQIVDRFGNDLRDKLQEKSKVTRNKKNKTKETEKKQRGSREIRNSNIFV